MLSNDQIYHIYTKSIAGYEIFNDDDEFQKMIQMIDYYQYETQLKLSYFMKPKIIEKEGFYNALEIFSKDKESIVQIIAYSLMPTHIHLIIKQLKPNGISQYMKKILDSYSRFFNLKHGRKGPLWESRFKNKLISTDELLLHITRYLHLNAVTAYLVDRPENWLYSSYKEYLGETNDKSAFCHFNDVLDINPVAYQKFVSDQIGYQRDLQKIKKLIIE